MNASTHLSFAERMGGALGRLWKKWLRLDDNICNRLATYGVPTGLIRIVLWAIKLIVPGALFYAAFWVALFLAIALAVAGLASAMPGGQWGNEHEPDWRTGPSGFGLYRGDIRIDIGDPCEDEGVG